MKNNTRFADFVSTLDYLEVCRVTISPDGEFSVPSEKDGRIVQVTRRTRSALAGFLREFADRLECEPKKEKRSKKR